MTIAELHGKLSADRLGGVHERLEDLLTSDVFGTMKYAGWEYGFLDWLLKAEPAPGKPLPPPISAYFHQAKIIQVAYSFWPTLKNNRVPDLALLFSFGSGDFLLILIEAKYFSGTSDWKVDEETNPYGLTGNQIADQVQGLFDMLEEDLLAWFQLPEAIHHMNVKGKLHRIHLFITMHTILPVQDYEYSKEHLSEPWPINAYWLSWPSLAECLKDHLGQSDTGRAALLSDLYDLLQRKGLVPFRGFKVAPWPVYQETPAFWYDRWWFLRPLQIKEYRPFWHQFFFQIKPIRPLPNGSFWRRR